ncbi:MAG: transcriptional repressor LexA [Treponema sp.]|jgi:repressor LexA|nr:transcriptional repressor LexA [Treponema sp.]
MKELTHRQGEVLTFIKECIKTHAYPPTIREVADFFEISVKGAYDHVEALKKKGYVKSGGKRSRTMELIKKDEEAESFVAVPLLGSVAAGFPILAEENLDGSIPIHHSVLRKNHQYFALKVRGDSMEEAGIIDGDTAVIEKQDTVPDGTIVVAVVDEAVTLKRFYKESNRIRLEPANSKYLPIYSQDVRILGRLSHLVRSY